MARDIHLAASALHHPSFARLKKHQRFNVLLLMSTADSCGRLTWRPDQLSWLLKCSPERWTAFAALLVEEGVLECDGGAYYLAEWLFAEADQDDYAPMPAAQGADRPRKPSDEREAQALRQRRSRANRQGQQTTDSEEADDDENTQEGVTYADVTPSNAENDPRDPSHGRAVTGIQQQERTKQPVTGNPQPGNGVPPPDATKRDKSQGGKGKGSPWQQKNLDLARHSTREIGDDQSMGFHIKCWNHARTCDQRANSAFFTDLLFALLRGLANEFKNTTRPQGSVWTARALKIFEDHGFPLPTLPGNATPEEIAEAAAALAHLQNGKEPGHA